MSETDPYHIMKEAIEKSMDRAKHFLELKKKSHGKSGAHREWQESTHDLGEELASIEFDFIELEDIVNTTHDSNNANNKPSPEDRIKQLAFVDEVRKFIDNTKQELPPIYDA